MTLLATTSLHGSPGATTLALALAGLRRRVLVEADPAGGVLAARCGLQREPGLASLAGERAVGDPGALDRNIQITATGLSVVPCSESAEHTWGLLSSMADHLADQLLAAESEVIVDVGRLGASDVVGPILERAEVVLVVVHPHVDQLAVLASRLPSLPPGKVLVVTVGDAPYRAVDVAEQLDVPATSIASDPRGADALWTGRRAGRLGSSALARSVVALDAVLPRVSESVA